MKKESERVVSSWKMKTGKNRTRGGSGCKKARTGPGGRTGKYKKTTARRQD